MDLNAKTISSNVKTWESSKSYNANIIGITSIVHRSVEDIDFGYIDKPLLNDPVESWDENNIPEWLDKIPMTHRGRSGEWRNFLLYI